MKAGLISLGCAKNLVDSETVLGLLRKNGFEIVNNQKEADLIFINTCGFIQSAKEEAISTIFETLKSKRDNQKVIVIGCFVERYKETLIQEIPEVAGWISISEYQDFAKILSKIVGTPCPINEFDIMNRVVSTPSYWAYVRIADGCDNHCAYCAIPLIRGKYKSRKISEIKKEVEGLVKKGCKEIVLIAQDTTRFGLDTGERIEDLLEDVATIPNLYLLRLLYLYPNDVSDELIQVIKKHPNIAPYFDLPMQHGSNSQLKLMNRRGTKEQCLELLTKIRKGIPNAICRTTVMVGFNQESEQDFTELLDFIKAAHFDRLGLFKFSKEEGTPSYTMSGEITDTKLVAKRYEQVIALQRKIAYQQSKQQIGKEMEALIVGYNPTNQTYSARSYAFAPDDVDGCIYIHSDKKYPNGSIVKVKITNCLIYDLEGQII